MGRGEEPTAGGSRWPRAIAHLAIVVVFVLTALGYAPLREHTAATVVADANGAKAKVDRVCDPPAPGDTPAGAVHVEDATPNTADAATTLPRSCQSPEGPLAFVQRKRDVDGASPDLRHTLKAPQAR